jgi:hypothetical protein
MKRALIIISSAVLTTMFACKKSDDATPSTTNTTPSTTNTPPPIVLTTADSTYKLLNGAIWYCNKIEEYNGSILTNTLIPAGDTNTFSPDAATTKTGYWFERYTKTSSGNMYTYSVTYGDWTITRKEVLTSGYTTYNIHLVDSLNMKFISVPVTNKYNVLYFNR